MLNKKSVDDINVKGKKVLVRCDFNVPLKEGKITDENRLVAALPTIKKLIGDGGRVILCSHLGKPKGEPKPELSLAPVAVRLSELLGQEVKFAADPEVVGPNAKAAVDGMKDGDVVLLENTRYRAEETKNGEDVYKRQDFHVPYDIQCDEHSSFISVCRTAGEDFRPAREGRRGRKRGGGRTGRDRDRIPPPGSAYF